MKRFLFIFILTLSFCVLFASCSLLALKNDETTAAPTTAAPQTTAAPTSEARTNESPAAATEAPRTTAAPATSEAPNTDEAPATAAASDTVAPETTGSPTTAAPLTTEILTTAAAPVTVEVPATSESPATTEAAVTTAAPETTAPPETTASPATTEPEPIPAQEDDLLAVRALYEDLLSVLNRSETAVLYDHPAIGETLHASSVLVRGEDIWTYQATVDRLNPADAEEFATPETLEPVSGTVEEIRQNYTGLFLWDRVATGLVLSTPAFNPEYLDSPMIREAGDNRRLTANIPDDALENVFQISLSEVSGVTVDVLYTDVAVCRMTLSYTIGGASVTVTVVYVY